MKKTCPCQSSLDYQSCCAPYHDGRKLPATAEALMRSRYSAYALNLGRYIFRTWHKSTRPPLKDLLQADDTQWLSLKIIDTKQGMEGDDTGSVSFVASYSRRNQLGQMTEVSRFEKVEGKWRYVEAII